MRRKVIAFLIAFSLLLQQSGWSQLAGTAGIPLFSPAPLVDQRFRPVHVRYLAVNPAGDFEVLLDRGDTATLSQEQIDTSLATLMRYFQLGVRLPGSVFWVNLRPDGEDQIIDPLLEKTDLGRVMLEADLQLKKDLARMTDPNTAEGKKYWDKLYARAELLFGPQENIEIPTLARPWIVPGEIVVGEGERGAYIYKATLSVMLEQDHLKGSTQYNFSDPRLKQLNEYAAGLIRASILPGLCRDINSAKRYAALRQAYYSLILAQWYKQRFKDPTVDSKDLEGLGSISPWSKKTYFEAYRTSFRQGEYHKQEVVGSGSNLSVRQYASGGLALAKIKDSLTQLYREPQGSFDPERFFNELGERVIRMVVPGEAAQQKQRQGRLEAIKEQHGLVGWNGFLEWEHGLAVFEKTEKGSQRIDTVKNGRYRNLQSHEIQTQIDKFLADKRDLLYQHTTWQRKDEGTNPRGMQAEEVVLLRVVADSQTYVAVVSVHDLMPDGVLAREDLIDRVKEFKSKAVGLGNALIPALEGHENQIVLLFQGRPGSGKSTGIKALQALSPGLIDRFNPTKFHYNWQEAVDYYKATVRIPNVGIDIFVNELMRTKYADRMKEADRLFEELLRLQDAHPQLKAFIAEKRAGIPAFITDASDRQSWHEIETKLGPDPENNLGENSPWTRLFTNAEIKAVEAEADRTFEEVLELFIKQGVSFIAEGSGLNKEREASFRGFEDRYLFSTQRIVYKINDVDIAMGRIQDRDKWADVMRNGIYKKRFEVGMKDAEEGYYAAKQAGANAQLERRADMVEVTDRLDVEEAKQHIRAACADIVLFWQQRRQAVLQKQGIDQSSRDGGESKPQDFAGRVEALKEFAYGVRAFSPYALARVFEGMLPEEMKVSIRYGEFETLCEDLVAIASDSLVNPHIRAEAVSALSNAYRLALKDGFRTQLQTALYGNLLSLAGVDDGMLEVQIGVSAVEETLANIPDKRVGYLLIMSLAREPKRLLNVVENSAISIQHRLYAAMVYSDVAGDTGLLQKKFTVDGESMGLAEMSAKLIRQQSSPAHANDYSLFENMYMQDEVLATYCFAVYLQVVDAFPALFAGRDINKDVGEILFSVRAGAYAAEADAFLFIGGEKDFLGNYDFWGIIAHELGHTLLPVLPMNGYDEQAIIELMCELLAAAVSQHVGFSMPRLDSFWEKEYNRGLLSIGEDFHRQARGQAHVLYSYESGFGDSYEFDAAALFLTGCTLMENYDKDHAGFSPFVANMIELSPLQRGDIDGVHRVSFNPTDTWVFPGEGSGRYKGDIVNLKNSFVAVLRSWEGKVDSKKRLQGARPDEVGGIDFRSLPAASAPIGVFDCAGINAGAWQKAAVSLGDYSAGELYGRIDASLKDNVLPDDQLFRQYIIASCHSGSETPSASSVCAMIARICWLEEEQGIATPEVMRDALLVVTASDPVAAMSTILSDRHA